MINPIDFYKQGISERGFFGAKQFYYNEMLRKYFNPSPDERTLEQLKAYNNLIPGKIYTFNYSPITEDLAYYDRRPIILSIRNYTAETTSNKIEFGINLNFIPSEIRRFMLHRLYVTYKTILENNEKLFEERKYGNEQPLFIDSYNYMKLLDYLWESVGKTAYRFALRNYIYPNMNNLKSIEYNDWGMLLFVDSKDMTGAKLSDIYTEYWRFKHKHK